MTGVAGRVKRYWAGSKKLGPIAGAFVVGVVGTVAAGIAIWQFWEEASPDVVADIYQVRFSPPDASPSDDRAWVNGAPADGNDAGYYIAKARLEYREEVPKVADSGVMPPESQVQDYFKMILTNEGRKAAESVAVEVSGTGLAVVRIDGRNPNYSRIDGPTTVTVGKLDGHRTADIRVWRSSAPTEDKAVLRHTDDLQEFLLGWNHPSALHWSYPNLLSTNAIVLYVLLGLAVVLERFAARRKRREDKALADRLGAIESRLDGLSQDEWRKQFQERIAKIERDEREWFTQRLDSIEQQVTSLTKRTARRPLPDPVDELLREVPIVRQQK